MKRGRNGSAAPRGRRTANVIAAKATLAVTPANAKFSVIPAKAGTQGIRLPSVQRPRHDPAPRRFAIVRDTLSELRAVIGLLRHMGLRQSLAHAGQLARDVVRKSAIAARRVATVRPHPPARGGAHRVRRA